MKNKLILFLISLMLLTGCGVHSGLTGNVNTHATQVQLGENNYKIIKRIEGAASCKYILGIGGIKKKALVAEARNEMLKEAGLKGTSRAIIYETVEVHFSTVLMVWSKYTVTVSAYLIEFTE